MQRRELPSSESRVSGESADATVSEPGQAVHLGVTADERLHLLARRIAVPHLRGGVIAATAPLPPHMVQSWNLLGLDLKRYDQIVEAPEE